jgi:hypothetical protein
MEEVRSPVRPGRETGRGRLEVEGWKVAG